MNMFIAVVVLTVIICALFANAVNGGTNTNQFINNNTYNKQIKKEETREDFFRKLNFRQQLEFEYNKTPIILIETVLMLYYAPNCLSKDKELGRMKLKGAFSIIVGDKDQQIVREWLKKDFNIYI